MNLVTRWTEDIFNPKIPAEPLDRLCVLVSRDMGQEGKIFH